MCAKLENQILLHCVKATPDEKDRAWFDEHVGAALNWHYILDTGSRHGITPLLYHYIRNIHAESKLPNEIAAELKFIYYTNMSTNMIRHKELTKIMDSFGQLDVSAMALKGAALAETVYSNLALRPMVDLDLLIREEDWFKAKRAFLDMEYVFPEQIGRVRETDMAQYAHYYNQVTGWNGRDTHLEVHFRLFNLGLTKPENLVWSRAKVVEIAGAKLLVPSVEDMLMHLLIHINIHSYSRLIWFSDIVRLLSKYRDEIDWPYCMRVAKERRIRASIFCTLRLTQELLGCAAPEDVLREIRPTKLRRAIFDRIWGVKRAAELGVSERPRQFQAPLYYLLEMDTAIDKMKYMRRILVPRIEWIAGGPDGAGPFSLRCLHIQRLLKQTWGHITGRGNEERLKRRAA